MKGTIAKCLEELVEQKFGTAKWQESLKAAGLPESQVYTVLSDVDDYEFRALLKAISRVLSIPMAQLMDEFGEHWSAVYAPKIYAPYYSGAKNARELLLSLDHVHEVMTKSTKFGRPPRFRYEWKGENLLIMHYQSERAFIDLMPGLIRGVGKYFHEKLTARIVASSVYVKFL